LIYNDSVFLAVFTLLALSFAAVVCTVIITIINLSVTFTGDTATILGLIIGAFTAMFGVLFAVGITDHFNL